MKHDADGLRVTDSAKEKSAFTDGDELSINGIFPILNFRRFDETRNGVGQRQQDPFTLTGLKVEVLNKTTVNGADEFTLRISYDDWTFESDKRWCDAINLPGYETLTVTGQANLSLELSGTANRTTHYKERNDPLIKNFVDPTILTAQPYSSIVVEDNSCINIKEESTLQIDENATLHLTSGGFIHIKDEDSQLILDDNAILQMDQNAEIIVKEGGSLVINTDDINLAYTSSKIIIEAGGILTTTTNQSFNFNGPGQLVIEEGAIVDMPFNFIGQGASHNAILFNNDSATGEVPFIEMEHDFYLADCKVKHNGGSHITINNSKVKLNNVVFINGNGPSTAFIGNALTYFLSKDCTYNSFDNGIVLNSYTSPPVNPNNPCSNPINPTFSVRNCDFNNITYKGISCTDAYRLYSYNNTFSNNVKAGSSNQKAIYVYNNNVDVVNNVIDNFNTGVYLHGGSFSNKKLYLSGGEISYCNYGVETELASADLKYCANIHHNFYGVHSTATVMKELTIGRKGGIALTDNHVAIRGVNVVVDIDAISATSANGGTHHPTNLSNSFIFFNLSYPNTTAPFGLSARGNYWGSQNGCGIGINAIGSYTVPPNFNIDDSQYENSAPTIDCHSLNTICNGATAGDSENTGVINTNFNLIYNISADYLAAEEYSNAYFGFSLVADFEDEPVYDL